MVSDKVTTGWEFGPSSQASVKSRVHCWYGMVNTRCLVGIGTNIRVIFHDNVGLA